MTKGNSGQTTGSQAQDWVNPLSGLDRIRPPASGYPPDEIAGSGSHR